MGIYWRDAGLNYVKYSNICAKVLRKALRVDYRLEAAKRNISIINFVQWKNDIKNCIGLASRDYEHISEDTSARKVFERPYAQKERSC
ncbi:hypothetical protein DOY81_005607 [Sarcophaga bullata]|nr:hypothetical protein DOY81_005607 [Sarcophaga bullata]